VSPLQGNPGKERGIGKMRVLRLSMQFIAFIMLFIFLACASTSTKFLDTWKDETYQGSPEKILVISTFKDPKIRRLFQDETVKALKDHKVDSVAKYFGLSDTVPSDKDAIVALAKEVGADAVLITGPAGTKRVASGDKYLNTHTDVYDMKTNKLISFASAETQILEDSPDPKHYLDHVPSYAKDLVNNLSQTGLLPKQ
jgi:hypothetical protein